MSNPVHQLESTVHSLAITGGLALAQAIQGTGRAIRDHHAQQDLHAWARHFEARATRAEAALLASREDALILASEVDDLSAEVSRLRAALAHRN